MGPDPPELSVPSRAPPDVASSFRDPDLTESTLPETTQAPEEDFAMTAVKSIVVAVPDPTEAVEGTEPSDAKAVPLEAATWADAPVWWLDAVETSASITAAVRPTTSTRAPSVAAKRLIQLCESQVAISGFPSGAQVLVRVGTAV